MAITITMRRASEESGLSIRTIQYAIARGKLRSVRVGKRRLIPVRALEDFLLRGSESGESSASGTGTAQRASRKSL
jgi:excisionase family DNA binding protein